MRRAGFAGILIVVALTSVATAASISAQKGQVGGPPSLPLGQADEGKKVTPALVIGRGPTYDGHVEITAYGWKPPADDPTGGKQFCTWIEYPPDDIEFGTCGTASTPPANGVIQIDSESQIVGGPPKKRWSRASGLITPKVAKVKVTFRRHGPKRHTTAVIGRVTDALRQKLDQPARFGYWDVKIRGHVRFSMLRARAFDADGNVLGTAKHLSSQTTFAR
jgi:hypothetical protein